jgi:hypothetical protein
LQFCVAFKISRMEHNLIPKDFNNVIRWPIKIVFSWTISFLVDQILSEHNNLWWVTVQLQKTATDYNQILIGISQLRFS